MWTWSVLLLLHRTATASPGPALPVPAPGPSPALTLLPAGPKAQPGKTEPAGCIHGHFCIKWVLDKRGLREEIGSDALSPKGLIRL